MAVLLKNHGEGAGPALSASDRRTVEYIERWSMEYYDDIMTKETDLNVFSQLSELRTGLLRWYPFRGGSRVLEIGAGFGALTGILCSKCGQVTAAERNRAKAEALAKRWKNKANLEVYPGDWAETNFGGGFDYIILTGTPECVSGKSADRETYLDYLKSLKGLLKTDGILLCAADNRYGLKYFCGEPDPHTHKPFDGLNRYPGGSPGYSFDRKELAHMVTAAGFHKFKFYYPLPDYKFPQFIYTDERLPGGELANRLCPYEVNEGGRIIRETQIYGDICRNGVFPFFANSFLVEAACGEDTAPLSFAAPFEEDGEGAGENRDSYPEKAGRFPWWKYPEKTSMTVNSGRLLPPQKDESYEVSDKMKKIWRVELEMLERVDVICSKYGIGYFMVHGTLLGAVRHKGFIPWDDDLDIGMLRKDYDRFLEAAAAELEAPFSIQTMWSEEDCFFGGYARVRNAATTGIQAKDIGHRSNQGIWIDILPFDDCTEDENRFRKKEKKIRTLHRLINAKIYGRDGKVLGDLAGWRWTACRLLAVFCSHRALCDKLDRAMRLYTEEKTSLVAAFTGYDKHRILDKEDFRSTVELEFAGRGAPAPCGYEHYLFMSMGGDYMKYPPQDERRPKHRGIFDPDTPYTEYLPKLTGMFENIGGKKIILFGAGMMFDDYMQKWGGRYRPDFLVDNDRNKWGRRRQGIEVRDPRAILELPADKRRVIICSYYYKEIEQQLVGMGVKEYQVYIQNPEWILQAES